ncbi:MAG: formylglycine-generating enzyme family protein [Planctomycetota bacterium]
MNLLSRVNWPFGNSAPPVPVAPPAPGLVPEVLDGRYVVVLRNDGAEKFGAAEKVQAKKRFEEKMTLVPAGTTPLFWNSGDMSQAGASASRARPVAVDDFYIDRYAVTNEEFACFVDAGGYKNMDLWPRAIWANVIQFVDQTGKPGPRLWSKGRPARSLMQHPVVGVSWFEATAYACWTGKQLPTNAQWQHAGTWKGDPECNENFARYPWGNGSCSGRANLYLAAKNGTVPVTEFYDGATANGVYQLVGNVWEWTASQFSFSEAEEGGDSQTALAEVRGGAFDTYFESQASCTFRSGHSLLQRAENVGFRLCVGVDNIIG